MQGMQRHPQFVSCVMPRQLFGQKFGCYLGKLWGKTENLVIIWAKFDIGKMNEIWLLPMWNLELHGLIVYCLPKYRF